MDNGQWTMDNGQWTMDNLLCLKSGVRHILTHQRLIADFYLLDTTERPTLPPDFIWVAESDLHHYAVPRLVEILFDAVRQEQVDAKH